LLKIRLDGPPLPFFFPYDGGAKSSIKYFRAVDETVAHSDGWTSSS